MSLQPITIFLKDPNEKTYATNYRIGSDGFVHITQEWEERYTYKRFRKSVAIPIVRINKIEEVEMEVPHHG